MKLSAGIKLAEQGDAGLQYCLGWLYYIGEGIKQDYNEAFRWFKLWLNRDFQ